jgi:predicted double-glycine peptidase
MIENKTSLWNFNFTGLNNDNNKNKDSKVTNKISVSQLNQPDYFLNSIISKQKLNKYFIENKNDSSRTEINFKIDYQGDTNSCGTTSLASILKYHGVRVKDHWEIDKSIRSTRFDFFTAPGDIVSYAKDKGMRAGMKNNSKIDDIVNYINKGLPVMTLIDPGANKYDTGLHWVVVNGYEKDSEGNVNKLVVSDPSAGYSYNQDIEDFKKEWSKINIGTNNLPLINKPATVSSGYKNLMIVIAPKSGSLKTPSGNIIQASEVKLPSNLDTFGGISARVFAKGAILLDKLLTLKDKYL